MTPLETSDDTLREHAYGVARGVRALAIAFVCPRIDTFADCGYAAAAWVIDLYRWIVGTVDDVLPARHRHRIVGLPLGYGVDAIASYEEPAAARACHQPVIDPAEA